MQRHKIRGNKLTWSLDLRNGWIRFGDTIVRWNTTWTESYTYFSITDAKAKK